MSPVLKSKCLSSNRELGSAFLLRPLFLAFDKWSQFQKIDRLQFSIVQSWEVILCGLSLICILLLGRNHYFLIAMKSVCANHLQEVATLVSVSSYSWNSVGLWTWNLEPLSKGSCGSMGEVP